MLLAVAGCTEPASAPRSAPYGPSEAATRPTALATGTAVTTGPPVPAPPAFDPDAARRTVVRLAAAGPREATSTAFGQAADELAAAMTELGYLVSRQRFRVPAGVSWGVPVRAGVTENVVARSPDLDPRTPYVVLGAHLDTVPQAPGAEDNASGVAVLLELARIAAAAPTRHPVVLVAFGAEEPRGPGDDEHHFGSQAFLRLAGAPGREQVLGMVSLDRVGARGRVPVCTGGLSPARVQRELIEAAARIGVPTRACENRTSDHWPFEKAGLTVARVGGNDSAGYHSAGDLPRTVSDRQLDRVGSVLVEWLRAR